ncbi:hypothetical protein ACP4OV_029339 [Aristida adscensionis]
MEVQGEKTTFLEEEEAAMAAAAAAAPASSSSAIFSFLVAPLSLLRHVAHSCAGFLGLMRPGTPATAPSSQHGDAGGGDGGAAAAEAVTEEEVVVVEVRPRRTTARNPPLTRDFRIIQGQGQKGGPHR